MDKVSKTRAAPGGGVADILGFPKLTEAVYSLPSTGKGTALLHSGLVEEIHHH